MKSVSYVSLEHEILPREIFTKIRTGHLPASMAGTLFGPCHRRTCPIFIIFMVDSSHFSDASDASRARVPAGLKVNLMMSF